MEKFIHKVNNIKKTIILSFIFSIVFLAVIIFFAPITTLININNVTNSEINLQGLSTSSIVILGVSLICVLILFIINIICALKCYKLENYADDNSPLSYEDFTPIKIISIVAIFFLGTIMHIILIVLLSNLVKKYKAGARNQAEISGRNYSRQENERPIENRNHQEGNYKTKNDSGSINSSNIDKISKAAQLYKDGLISKDEFERIKSDLI